jgi:hypothetical protein
MGKPRQHRTRNVPGDVDVHFVASRGRKGPGNPWIGWSRSANIPDPQVQMEGPLCANCRALGERDRSVVGLLPASRLRSADPLRHALVYNLGLLCLAARSLHDVVPTLCGGVVLAADRVAVDVGGRAHG